MSTPSSSNTPPVLVSCEHGAALQELLATSGALIGSNFRCRMAAQRLERGDITPAAFAESDRAHALEVDARNAAILAWARYGQVMGFVTSIEFLPSHPDHRERPGA